MRIEERIEVAGSPDEVLAGALAPLARPLFALHGRIVLTRLRAVLEARAAGAEPVWSRSA